MDDKDWITLFMHESEAVMTLWSLYILVVALIVGFVAQKEPRGHVRWVLLVAFVVFAIVNAWPMYDAQVTVIAIHERVPMEAREVLRTLPACVLVIVHLILDLLVAALLMGWGGRRGMAHMPG